MEKHCANCGKQITEDMDLCSECGANIVVSTDNPKKNLTEEIIKNDLRKQRRTLKGYSDGIVIVVCSIVLLVCGSGLGVLAMALGLLKILRIVFEDVLKTIGKYYVLERPCIDGNLLLHEDETKEYRLLFVKKSQKKPVYLKVEDSFFYECNAGDEFYVVFLKGQKHPCLCYKKTEWTM